MWTNQYCAGSFAGTKIAREPRRGCWPSEGPAVQKPIKANPGLKVNRGLNFSCIKVFFTANVLWSLRLLKVKTEGEQI